MNNHILDELMEREPRLIPCRGDMEKAFELIRDSFAGGGKLMTCGNGGSCSDAEHIVGELGKGFLKKRPLSPAEKAALNGEDGDYLARTLQGGLPALSLNLPALHSAAVNDLGGDMGYAQAAWALARQGDVMIGISTSGNARNVALAAQAAKARGALVIGLTGQAGGRLAGLSDVCVKAPARETYRVQEYHIMLYHALCAMVEEAFFEE